MIVYANGRIVATDIDGDTQPVGVIRYIENKGTSNPQIQDIIYEQATIASQKDSPAYILKEVVKILKK